MSMMRRQYKSMVSPTQAKIIRVMHAHARVMTAAAIAAEVQQSDDNVLRLLSYLQDMGVVTREKEDHNITHKHGRPSYLYQLDPDSDIVNEMISETESH